MRITTSLICAMTLLATGQAAEVTNVALRYHDGSAVAGIDIKGPVRFTHQTEEAKDGRPFRVIVDVLSATHQLPAKDFPLLPNCPVRKIRTSQFSVKPEKIVRLVFDMEQETVYRVDSDDKSISLFFPDRQERSFADWSAAAACELQQAAAQKPGQPTPIASATKAAGSQKSVAELNEAINEDRLLSLAGEPAAALPRVTTRDEKKPIPPASKPEPAKSIEPPAAPAPSPPKAVERPAVVVSVPYGPEFDEKLLQPPALETPVETPAAQNRAPKPSIDDKGDSDAGAPKRSEAITQPSTAAKTAPSDKQTAEVKADDKKVVLEAKPKQTQSSGPAVAEKPQAKPPRQRMSPLAEDKPAVDKAVAAASQAGKASPLGQGKDKPQPEPKVTTKKTVSPPAATEQDKKAEQAQDSTGALKPKPDADKKKSTSRFRRSPTRPTKIKGTLVAEFPKRLVIKYKSRGSRDPFETLINESKTYNNPVEKRVPNVEGLTLVGVLESETGTSSALFEGKDGYGYILKEGDKVQKGYVLRVEPDRVYFQIFEYGWSRTVALNIDED